VLELAPSRAAVLPALVGALRYCTQVYRLFKSQFTHLAGGRVATAKPAAFCPAEGSTVVPPVVAHVGSAVGLVAI
jgi:hypothetical protein